MTTRRKFIKNISAKVKEFANWLYKTLGYKGFAKGFAMAKYRTFKPSNEQINCMIPFAKIVISIMYLILVALFLIKAAPYIATAATANDDDGKDAWCKCTATRKH